MKLFFTKLLRLTVILFWVGSVALINIRCGTECGNPFGRCGGDPLGASSMDNGERGFQFTDSLNLFRVTLPKGWELIPGSSSATVFSNNSQATPASSVSITVIEDIDRTAMPDDFDLLEVLAPDKTFQEFINANFVKGYFYVSPIKDDSGGEVVDVYYPSSDKWVYFAAVRNYPAADTDLILNSLIFLK